MHSRILRFVAVVMVTSLLPSAGYTHGLGLLPKKDQKELPHCEQPLGRVSVSLPEEVIQQQWGEMGLDPPTSFVKELVKETNCFTVVEGRGRVDYYLRPTLSFTKGNVFGSSIGSLAALVPGVGVVGTLGASALGFQAGKSKIYTNLLLIDPSTQAARFEGKNSFRPDTSSTQGRAFGSQANTLPRSGDDSYAGTSIGRSVSSSYRKAFADLIDNVRKNNVQVPTQQVQPESNITQVSRKGAPVAVYEFTAPKAVNLRTTPSSGKDSSVLRMVSQGELLRAVYDSVSGSAVVQNGWTKVADTHGNEGWIRTDLLLRIQQPSDDTTQIH